MVQERGGVAVAGAGRSACDVHAIATTPTTTSARAIMVAIHRDQRAGSVGLYLTGA
jgi:D-arabinose 5-phosphate isomerase GutQ